MGVHILGVDEAGRGPVIGPLVVCSLCIPKSDYGLLKIMGVNDSKKLSRKKREYIFEEIMKFIGNGNWTLGIRISSALEIDSNSINSDLNTLEIELFVDSILKCANENCEGVIYADACDVDEKRFGIRLREGLGIKLKNWEIISKHGMDSINLVTSAASIVAKVIRDNEIKDLERSLDIEIGSGYPSDPKTIKAVIELCNGKFPHDSIRWSWSTVRKVWKELGRGNPPIRNYDGQITVETRIDDWG